jgi:CheY-like chemotaxis protein
MQKLMTRYKEIYLIDDFEMVNLMHGILLRKLGQEDNVKPFTNPELALDELRSKMGKLGPTLIILDINMPEMSGFEFLDLIASAEFPDNIDIIIVSSSISEKDKDLALKYPRLVCDHIAKPLKLDQLQKLLERGADHEYGPHRRVD